MFVGIGVGIGRQHFASGIFSAYAARVAADGGVTEAGACVDAVSDLLKTASLLLVPSGYKSGKVYSQIPTNGNGDLTFTRASTAVRTNSTGLLESMATGVPRLSYMYGSCPALLLEPQRTNLVFPSETATTQTRTVTAVAHTLSFFGTGTVVLSGAAIGTLIGTGANNRVTLTFTPTAGSLTLTVTGTVTLWQLEAGAYATTYIPTTTATVTRIADAFTRDNIFTNGLITSSGGTWFVELRNNIAYTRDGLSTGLFLDTDANSYTNGINIRNAGGGSTRLSISKWVSGSGLQLYTTTTDTTKIAIKWNGSTADVFVNGTKVISATSFTPTAMQFLKSQGNLIPIFIQQMALYPTPLSDTACIALTTL